MARRIPVRDIDLRPGMGAGALISSYREGGGFTAKHLATALDILVDMEGDRDCIKFLSFPACIISTGARGVVKELLKRKLVDIVITTCGTLDHDLARVWKDYYHGEFFADDRTLHKKGVNRLGNIFIPNASYGVILEKRMQSMLKDIWKGGKREFSTKEIAWEFGRRIEDESSILYWAAKNEIPIYVPGITDGAFGFQLWMFSQSHKDFRIDLFRDETELSDVMFTAKSTGALMIGGGISKHHTIWWNQFRGGLDYAVYITTAMEYDGSLSGARVREAVSWGKVSESARYVTVDGDATVMLPLLVSGLLEELKKG